MLKITILSLLFLFVGVFSQSCPAPTTCSATSPIINSVCTGTNADYNVGEFAKVGACGKNDYSSQQYPIYSVIIEMKKESALHPDRSIDPTNPCTQNGWNALFEHLCLNAVVQCVPVPPAKTTIAPFLPCKEDCNSISDVTNYCNVTMLLNVLIAKGHTTAASNLNSILTPSYCNCLQPVGGFCRQNTVITANPNDFPTPVTYQGMPTCSAPSYPNVLADRFGYVCNDYPAQIHNGADIGPVYIPTTLPVNNVNTQENQGGSISNIDTFISQNGNEECPQLNPPPTNFTGAIDARIAYSNLACSFIFQPLDSNNMPIPPCRDVCERAVAQCGGFEIWLNKNLAKSLQGSFAAFTAAQICETYPIAGGPLPCNKAPYVQQYPPIPELKTFIINDLKTDIKNQHPSSLIIEFTIKSSNPYSTFDNPYENVQITGTLQYDDNTTGTPVTPFESNTVNPARQKNYRKVRKVTHSIELPENYGTRVRFCISTLSYTGFIDDITPICVNLWQTKSNAPNIILIIADDLGFGDIALFDSNYTIIPTPHINKMASEGLIHRQMLMGESTCTPSRAALMTGRLPIRFDMASSQRRVIREVADPAGINVDEYLIGDLLKEYGYNTGYFGKWHLGMNERYYGDYQHLPFNFGYDEFYGLPLTNGEVCTEDYFDPLVVANECFMVKGTHDDGEIEIVEQPFNVSTLSQHIADNAIEFLKRVAPLSKHQNHPARHNRKDYPQHQHRKPFHAIVAFAAPHVTLGRTAPFVGVGGARGEYGDVVAELDYNIGRILQTLVDLGVDKDTYVLFSSDNGPALEHRSHGGKAGVLKGGKGQSSWEGGIRVPGISWWPGTIPAGSQTNESYSNLDVLPTIASLIGAKAPFSKPLDGRDYSAVLKNPQTTDLPNRFLAHYCGKVLQAIRYGDYKLHIATVKWTGQSEGIQGCPPPPGGLELFVCQCTFVTVWPAPNLTAVPVTNWPPIYDMINDIGENHPLPWSPPLQNWYLAALNQLQIFQTSLGTVPQGSALLSHRLPYLQPYCDTFDPNNPLDSCPHD